MYKLFFSPNVIFFKLLVIFSISSFSQTFNKLNTKDFRGGYIGLSSFVDYNNDGFLDVFVTGVDFKLQFKNAVFYKNNGDSSFSESTITNIPRVIYGDCSWGDYDNNGTLDLLYSGTTGGPPKYGISKIYKNLNNGCGFKELSFKLPGITDGTSRWVDIDNDGLLDVFLAGIDVNNQLIVKAYKNLGDDNFREEEISTIDKLYGIRGNSTSNVARWVDFDGDGLKDLVLALSTKSNFSVNLYKNLGNFQFSKQNTSLPNLSSLAIEVGDMNNDGLKDLVFTGSPNVDNDTGDGTGDLYVFINKGEMKFNNLLTVEDEGVLENDIELGDINNDGFLDVINYGTGPWGTSSEITKIYQNNKDGTLTEMLHNLPKCRFGGVELGDFDNDNDLDILYFGRINDPYDNEITYIYENKIIDNILPTDIVTETSCSCNNALTFLLNADSDSVKWDFGDTKSGKLNTSTEKKVNHTFSEEGNYIVTVTYKKGNVTKTLTKEVYVGEPLKIATPSNLEICENDINKIYDFELLKDSEILNSLPSNSFEVSYYSNYKNSEEGRFKLKKTYQIKDKGERIYVRIQNKLNPNCFTLTNFEVNINTLPEAKSIDYFVCDENNDGFSFFDLKSKEKEITTNNEGLVIEYYDAMDNIIPVNSLNNYKNSIINKEVITTKVIKTATDCFTEMKINLFVIKSPQANSLQDIFAYDDDKDGISEFFDTSNVESIVLGNQTGVEVSYYDALGNKLPSPLPNPYTNKTSGRELIKVRVTNTLSQCYSETSLNLIVKLSTDSFDYPIFFTPNNDGYNDFWQIKGVENFPNSKIEIYDRFGKLLKTLTAKDIGWDGFYNNIKMPSNSYWFKAVLDEKNIFSGYFALKR
ncbi:FG-GAP-like repeat-containing protein [Tenacibaculum discolor]|uniref:FG-GAP-like repeat-containing protein n=1 Tax=Tenacibaculum discolor TaxID=361581 RepID=UPI000F0F8339|nr:FG-GAP-like repeat-containing protein [Tenacibaculum discolor]RLK02344.1 gliding motility-associated-like protein [Tenacibaculum discolor]